VSEPHRIHDLLRQAQAALTTFDRPRAHQILTEVIQIDPNNEDAWGLLSNVVADPRDKRQCLERVLQINPTNVSAQKALRELNQVYAEQQRVLQPSKNSRAGMWLLLIIIVLVGFCAFGNIGTSSRGAGASTSSPRMREITYRVTGVGTSRASLTIENEQRNTEQHDVNLPSTWRFKAAPGQFVYVSAQNNSAYGEIKCEILVDGKPFKEATSTADYGIASCSGSTP
jgi:hypothetical protein